MTAVLRPNKAEDGTEDDEDYLEAKIFMKYNTKETLIQYDMYSIAEAKMFLSFCYSMHGAPKKQD